MISRGGSTAQTHEAGMSRALVLDAHSDAGIEVVQSLGRAGVEVDVCAPEECVVFRSRYVTGKYRQMSVIQADVFREWVRALDGQAHYDLIVPSTERALRGVRRFGSDDPIRAKTVLPSDGALDIALDKQRTWMLARDLDIPVPECSLIESLDRLPPVALYPVVLKTTQSLILMGDRSVDGSVALIQHPEERLDFLRRYLPHGPVQQQAFVSGHGFGIEFLYNRGEPVWHFAHERIHEGPKKGGASSYRRSLEPPETLLQAARRLLDTLNWHGVAMVEFRAQEDGRFYLMEINPRLWGSLALAIDAGVDFPLGLLGIAKEEPVSAQPRYRRNYYARNISEDIFWQLSNLKAHHGDPLFLTRPRLVTLLEHLRPLVGRESWDHFDWRDLSVMALILKKTASQVIRMIRGAWGRMMLARYVARRHKRLFGRQRAPETRIENIVFVCQGNICRSPFAADLASRRLPEYHVESAGFTDSPGRRTPEEILELAHAKGIDLSGHASARITKEQVDRSDLILVMDLENYRALVQNWPEAAGRTTMLGLFASQPLLSIADPYGASELEASQALDWIVSAIEGLSAWLGAAGDGERKIGRLGQVPISRTSDVTQ
jgi:protein-tyrosine-phosphatase